MTTIAMPPLHATQKPVKQSKARFRVLACGRRWGKTRLGSAECVGVGLMGKRAWWIAPSYKMANVGWRLIRRLAAQIPGADIKRGEKAVYFPGGGEVAVRSADNPDSLRGEGLDFAVLDECAFIKDSVWPESIRPALSDRKGGAMFISTPKGRNWFWRLWVAGNDDKIGDWKSFHFSTTDNPYIDPEEVATAKNSLPSRVFQQEYLAEFIDDAGGVFRGVMAAATSTEQQQAIDNHEYVIGVDWGKHNDFTVISVFDMDEQRQVLLDRFNQIDYSVQRGRLMAIANRFNDPLVVAERNSIGEPILEQLRNDGLRVWHDHAGKPGFYTTVSNKQNLINDWALAFESGNAKILMDDVQIAEHQAYEMERMSSGNFRYNAPSGMHDDTVIASALAWSQCQAGDLFT